MKALTLESGAEDLVIRARNGDQNAMGMIAEVRKAALAGVPKAKAGFEAIRKFIERNPVKGNETSQQPSKWQKPRDTRDSVMGTEAVNAVRAIRAIAKHQSTMGAESASDKDLTIVLINLPLVGGERALNAGTVALANGPDLTDARIRQIGEAIPDETIRALFYQFVVQYCPNGNDNAVPPSLLPVAKAGQVVGQARAIQMLRLPSTSVSSISPNVGYELGEKQVQAMMDRGFQRHIQQYHTVSSSG